MDTQTRGIATDLAAIANAVADLVGTLSRGTTTAVAEAEHTARALAQELCGIALTCEEIKREMIRRELIDKASR